MSCYNFLVILLCVLFSYKFYLKDMKCLQVLSNSSQAHFILTPLKQTKNNPYPETKKIVGSEAAKKFIAAIDFKWNMLRHCTDGQKLKS